MRIAVFSDVHGNLEAFKRVLEDMDGANVDRVVCLGDTLGYGPEPQECVDLLRARGIPSVMGNHEWGLTGKKRMNWFNFQSREALERTGRLIDGSAREWLAGLPRHLEADGAWFVHGMPPDSVTTYMYQKDADELVGYFEKVGSRMIFVGHTHVLALAEYDGARVRLRDPAMGIAHLDGSLRYMVNVGAVGQPRDGDRRAKYVIWECAGPGDGGTLDVRFVDYDLQKTLDMFALRKMPERYAQRLLNP